MLVGIDMIDSRPKPTASSDVLSVGGDGDGIVEDKAQSMASRALKDDCSGCEATTVPVDCDGRESLAVQGPDDGAIGRR